MRVQCEVVFVNTSAANPNRQSATRAQRAFAIIEKKQNLSQAATYRIVFAFLGGTRRSKHELRPPPQLMTPFLSQGKATITFPSTPAVQVLISKANPEKLNEFIEMIRAIVRGDPNVALQAVGPEAVVKRSDFKPTAIVIKSRSEYSKQAKNFSERLEELTVKQMDLRMPDRKWETLVNLTGLILDGNPFGSRGQNLDVFQRLRSLQRLQLDGCSLGEAPKKDVWAFFHSLPPSLVELDISNNGLTVFPPIFQLLRLRHLKCNNNQIVYLPSRIGEFVELIDLELLNNRLLALPDVPVLNRIRRIRIDGNQALIFDNIEAAPNCSFQLPTRGGEFYGHGGVDSLVTIAANTIHRSPVLMEAARELLPLDLRFRTHDLTTEEPQQSSVELCCHCRRLRHIRVVMRRSFSSRNLGESIDLINKYVTAEQRYCIDCVKRMTSYGRSDMRNAFTWPLDPDYFKFAA